MLVTNPAAGGRHAEEGDLERCQTVLRDAGFDLDIVETGAEKPTSADLARRAIADGYPVCIVAGGGGAWVPAAAGPLGTRVVLRCVPVGCAVNNRKVLGLPLEPVDAARLFLAHH